MEGYNHIVLLYEDQKYADLIIARYFLNGLKKGESCVFFTADRPETIEERLSAEGIDVESYKRIGRLRVYRAKRSYSDDLDALSILKNIRQEATRGMKPPYRFVGRTITDIESKEGMLSGMAVEKTGHEHFREFDNSQMCYYDLSRLEQTMKDEWIRGLLRNHHQAIYASEPDRAVAFETTLLEVGE
jgi:hypothetical protein